jgi:hypothetical protein
MRFATTYGGNARNNGGTNGRLRPNGSIVERNNFVGAPIHRVDMRLQKQLTLGKVKVSALLDLFNVMNRANYGTYTTQESSANYGKPTQNANVAFSPRMLQFAFRTSF